MFIKLTYFNIFVIFYIQHSKDILFRVDLVVLIMLFESSLVYKCVVKK